MKVVNIHDAKTHLSRLVQDAAAGQEVVIARAGKPVARLVPYRRATKPRAPGGWSGKVRIAADFETLPPDVAAAFGLEGD